MFEGIGGKVVVIAATAIEAAAVRRVLPSVRVCEAGIALSKLAANALDGADVVISCGLAGGLSPNLPTGSVLIPKEVRRPDGTMLRCDPAVVEALTISAQRLLFAPVDEPLLTSSALVRGAERARWAQLGYGGVDMESGLVHARRIAVVRVVLDTPQHELRADWLSPGRALCNPRNWPEALWLARSAPRYARRAAEIVAATYS